jgi:hypothetical protein
MKCDAPLAKPLPAKLVAPTPWTLNFECFCLSHQIMKDKSVLVIQSNETNRSGMERREQEMNG